MGGRGASSGISDKGKKYGTEYTTLYQSGNIKFVRYNDRASKAPMETMTNGRIYVTVNANNVIKYISYYDKHLKHYKQIDVDHFHYVDGVKAKPHVHFEYEHNEKGDKDLSPTDRKMVERIKKTWYSFLNR